MLGVYNNAGEFINEAKQGDSMSLITIVLALVVVGVILFCINNYIPMEGRIKQILNIVVIVAVVIFLLKAFGIWSYLSAVHV